MTELNLYSAAVPKVLKFLTMKEKQKPTALARAWLFDEESMETLAALTQIRGCTSAGSPRSAAKPLTPGNPHVPHTQTQRCLVRLHADKDNNEDNDDDK